jgi:hypothetical protein
MIRVLECIKRLPRDHFSSDEEWCNTPALEVVASCCSIIELFASDRSLIDIIRRTMIDAISGCEAIAYASR